jgi:hypothetical protein
MPSHCHKLMCLLRRAARLPPHRRAHNFTLLLFI